MADLVKLKAEIIGDPLPRGYSGMDDQATVVSLTTQDRPKPRTSMSGREVRSHITDAGWDGIADPEKRTQLLALLSSDDLDPFGFDANVVKDILGGGSASLNALVAARDGLNGQSRAEELGLGFVDDGDVRAARSLV